jgi:hypothetical protein
MADIATLNGVAEANIASINGHTARGSSVNGVTWPDPYSMQLVLFDGSSDYLTRGAGLTGASDGKSGIVSFWSDLQGGDGSQDTIFYLQGGYLTCERFSNNKYKIDIYTSGATKSLEIDTSSTYTSSSGMKHILFAWDVATSTAQCYVSDSNDAGTATTLNNTLDYTRSNWGVGARDLGTEKINTKMGDLYFNIAETLDISSTANRRKFIDASGNPVDLGSDGSTPTGSAPIMFFSGAVASWHTNKGSGGGFTENGTLTDAGVYP